MKFEVKNIVEAENISEILKGYYLFFEKMYGIRRLPIFQKSIEYTLTPTSVLDKNDGNLKEAIETVEKINNDSEMFVLNALDESGKLIAMARFKIFPKVIVGNPESAIHVKPYNEVHIAEILFLDNISYNEGIELYKEMVQYLINYNKTFGYPFDITVEVPKKDLEIIDVLEDSGFSYDLEKDFDHRYYQTILLEKHISITLAEYDEIVERNSSR